MALLASAAERRAAAPLLQGVRRPWLSIDISCPLGAQQQTRRSGVPWANETDRRTDTVPLHTGWAKKRGHRLMTIILSNLNRFKKFFHWKILW